MMRRRIIPRRAPLLPFAAAALFLAADALGAEERETRTEAQVEALIKRAGRTPPAWWNSVPLNYPQTLDLTWPKPKGKWDPQKNLSQYMWNVINQDPGKWKEGVRLLHHVLTVNGNDPATQKKAMNALGAAYHGLLQDWARAAFWWRKAGGGNGVNLADCYWQLGNRNMAAAVLTRIGRDRTGHGSVIKLWADIGELKRALSLAKDKARTGKRELAYLVAGDACRRAGSYKMARAYYDRVLASKRSSRNVKRLKARAQDGIEGIKAFEAPDLRRVPDGAWRGSAAGYRGDVHVEVTVNGGRIGDVKIGQHREDQFLCSITQTPKDIVEQQGVRGVDAVTGATVTSEAIINAAAKALANALK